MKSNFFSILISFSLIVSACGSGSEELYPAANDANMEDYNAESDGGTRVDVRTDLSEDPDEGFEEPDTGDVDCAAFLTRETCVNDACSQLVAVIYQSQMQCYGPQEFAGCGIGGNHSNTETPARHTDGTCAIFSSSALPSNGEWTVDNKCDDLRSESGFCD